jgi:hypothetical protein
MPGLDINNYFDMRLVTINDVEYIFLLQTLTKVFISRILINFYSINHIKKKSGKQCSEAVASLPLWKLSGFVSFDLVNFTGTRG